MYSNINNNVWSFYVWIVVRDCNGHHPEVTAFHNREDAVVWYRKVLKQENQEPFDDAFTRWISSGIVNTVSINLIEVN